MIYQYLTLITLLLAATVGAENFYPVKNGGTRTYGYETYESFAAYNSRFASNDNADYYGLIGDVDFAANGGEWIVIEDGTYSENVIVNGIDGSKGNNTVIRARNDWGVTLSPGANYGFKVQDNYVVIRGIHTGGGVYIDGASYVKIIRCSATFSGGTWTFVAGNGAKFALFEECFTYGGPHRYMFGSGGESHYVVVRRCLGRWDYSTFGFGHPLAVFAHYGAAHTYFQNCIAIDGTENSSYKGTYRGTKGFKAPNGSDNGGIDGCIVLNFDGPGIFLENGSNGWTINNTIIWDLIQTDTTATYARAWGVRNYGSATNMSIVKMTMGDNLTGNTGIEIEESAGDLIEDSILYSISGVAVATGFDTNDSNLYYGNGSNGDTGTNATTKEDPIAERLLYLPRIESGEDGANMLYRIGATASSEGDVGGEIDGLSGKLYGEIGWNTLTSDGLWPFPNEDEIKANCAAFSMSAGVAYSGSPAMTGARGFATGTSTDGSKQTLTKYIWEYLGNKIPSNLYESSPAPIDPNPETISSGSGCFIGM